MPRRPTPKRPEGNGEPDAQDAGTGAAHPGSGSMTEHRQGPRPAAARPSASGPQAAGHTAPRATSAKVVPLDPEQRCAPPTELPTDAINVVPSPRPRPAGRRRAPDPEATPTPGKSARSPRLERAKQKQSQRRRVDRVKFSAAVRRNPAEAQPPTQPAEPGGEPVAAHRFSGRVAALLVVLAFFAVMLVPTVNHYRAQMQEINELRASITAMEAERDALKEEIARWDDPLYIKQQARDRINLVMPGERVYMVVGERPSAQEDELANGSTYEVRQELPWVDALLDSVRRSATD